MLKIITGLTALVACFFIGMKWSDVYKQKVKFYVLLSDLNSDLKRNLAFRRENVSDIIGSEKYSATFLKIYSSLQREPDCPVSEIKQFLPNCLNADQKNRVIDYFSNIGKNDTEGEEKLIEYNEKIISDELERSVNEQKKYKNMGEKLGFGLGLIVFVLIL